MSKLPHRTAPGRTYFASAVTWERRELFRMTQTAGLLVGRILACRERGAYFLHEFVVMPNHFHLLVTPRENTSLEKAVQLVKGGFSHEFHKERKNRMEVWQAGFHDWTIRDAEDYGAKVGYIHMNPVNARLVERPEEWAYGSACGKYFLDAVPEKFKS